MIGALVLAYVKQGCVCVCMTPNLSKTLVTYGYYPITLQIITTLS